MERKIQLLKINNMLTIDVKDWSENEEAIYYKIPVDHLLKIAKDINNVIFWQELMNYAYAQSSN